MVHASVERLEQQPDAAVRGARRRAAQSLGDRVALNRVVDTAHGLARQHDQVAGVDAPRQATRPLYPSQEIVVGRGVDEAACGLGDEGLHGHGRLLNRDLQ